MENIGEDVVQSRINAIEILMGSMGKGRGRTIGNEKEKREEGGWGDFIPSDGSEEYYHEFLDEEKENFEAVNKLLGDCDTIEGFAEKMKTSGHLYLDDIDFLEGAYLDSNNVKRVLKPREGYVSKFPQEIGNIGGDRFRAISEYGAAWTYLEGDIKTIPTRFLFDSAFVVGLLNGRSDFFRREMDTISPEFKDVLKNFYQELRCVFDKDRLQDAEGVNRESLNQRGKTPSGVRGE